MLSAERAIQVHIQGRISMRLRPTDDVRDALVKMVDGNPGAVNVCIDLLKYEQDKYPELGIMAGMPLILALDMYGIYGSRIWMLYKDFCGESIPNTIATLIARSHELISQEELDMAINNRGINVDLPSLVKLVEEEYPELRR
jgi:hypothetical protein